MNSIPHYDGFIQVTMPPEACDSDVPQTHFSIKDVGLSSIQREAFQLYDLGFNVFPQPIGHKGGLPWKRLQHTRLNRDDRAYGIRKLFAGQCNVAVMCGRTSENLFVIDCESLDSFRHNLEQLHKRDIPIWAARTARGGHIYLRASDGEVENIPAGILTNAEIKGCNGYVLAPPSVHPNGDVYEWLIREGSQPPTISSKTVNWLRDAHNNKICLSVTPTTSNYRPGNWKHPKHIKTRLSRATQLYIQQGATLPEGSRNNRLFSAACDLYGNGASYDETCIMLLPIAQASGLSTREATTTIQSAYSKQRTPARPANTQPNAADACWYAALLFGTQHNWQGRTRNTDRTLFLTLVERCRVASNENGVFRASIRETAALSRFSPNTVQASLKRLIKSQLILACGHDQQSNASLWRFTDTVIQSGQFIAMKSDTVSPPPHWLSFSESVFNSDVTERGALGHGVMFIYQYLCQHVRPAMPKILAAGVRCTVNQVNYALSKLRKYGLVIRCEDGWLPVVYNLQELEAHMAQFVDVEGAGEARRERFQRERAVFAGRQLFYARLKREGQRFRQLINDMMSSYWFERVREQVEEALDDPLLALGLELGGSLRLDEDCGMRCSLTLR